MADSREDNGKDAIERYKHSGEAFFARQKDGWRSGPEKKEALLLIKPNNKNAGK